VTALDVLSIVLLLYTIRALDGRGVRIAFGETQLSLGSWIRLLAWTVAVVGVRQLLWREVPWHRRVGGWIRGAVTAEPFRAAWPPALASRVLALGVGFLAVTKIGINPPRPFQAFNNEFLDLFARWDGGWYYVIAGNGYPIDRTFNPQRESAIAFFPGLPLLMRLVRSLLNVNLWTAGILVVSVAFVWALMYVYRLAREYMPPDQARAALMFLAFYPFAVCYSAVLTESLFLLAAAGAFYHFHKDQLIRAAAFATFAGIVRPNGFLLAAPLGLLALIALWRTRQWKPFIARAVVVAMPVAAMLTYSGYVYTFTGDPFAWAKAQQAWGRTSSAIVDIISARSDLITERGFAKYLSEYPIEVFEAIATFFGLAAVWPITRRFGIAYGLFVAMAILPPFVTMGPVSLGRYIAPLFPIFLWLGEAVPERRRPYWMAIFGGGQALVAVLFYTWRPPY
jgi:hypothetical protein